MDKFEKIETETTKNLELKIQELRTELKAEIRRVLEGALSPLITELLAQFGLAGEVAVITWDFEEDSDDEGGTVWYPYNIKVAIDGHQYNMDELAPVKRHSKYNKEALYDYYLDEDLNDVINSFKGQLIDLGINEKLTIKIGGKN